MERSGESRNEAGEKMKRDVSAAQFFVVPARRGSLEATKEDRTSHMHASLLSQSSYLDLGSLSFVLSQASDHFLYMDTHTW